MEKNTVKRKKLKVNWKQVALISIIVGIGAFIFSFVIFLQKHNDNQRENSYVATVNGESISVKEFRQMIDKGKASIYKYFKDKFGVDGSGNFWNSSYGGESPVDRVKKEAMDEGARIKVQQILARQKGAVDDISYSAFLKKLDKENKRREEAVKKREVIFGPVHYNPQDYFDYLFSNMLISLKEKLAGTEIKFTKDGLKNYYESVKENLYKKENTIIIQKIFLSCVDKEGNISKSKREENSIKIERAKARMDKGEKFETLAMEYNEDEKDKKTYGEQTFDRTTMRYDFMNYPKLKEEAQKLAVGQVSEIIEDNNAFYIIKCIEKGNAEYESFDKVKDNVELKYIDMKYEEMVNKLVKEAKVEINKKIYEWIKVK